MIKKFNSFLNEAARSKFPEYAVGDLVIIGKYHEFQWKSNLASKSWETYSKYATSSSLGMIGKIAAIDTEKKEYAVEFVSGVLQSVYRGRSSSTTAVPDGKYAKLAYLRVKQNQLATEGLTEIQKLLKDDTYEPGEMVSVRLNGEKSVTRKLEGVSIMKSIENKELTYLIKDVTGTVKSSNIESEIDIKDDIAASLLAEFVAKTLGTTLEKEESTDFVFSVSKLEGKDLVKGNLYFKDDSTRDKFCEDLQKFIEKKLDKNFQKVMNGGESSEVFVTKIGASMYSWYKGTIKKNKIVQAARNLGINVKEFLEKNRGRVTGKKFGL
jgi:hypothetical protein